jgi:hypothetical protein
VLLNEVAAPQIYRVLLNLDGEDGFFRDRFRVLNIHKSFTNMLEEANNKQKHIIHAKVSAKLGEEITFYPDGSFEIRGGYLTWK